jgi:hypothetical protein
MAIAAFVVAALLALVPQIAGAHGAHPDDGAPLAAEAGPYAPPSAWPAPCPGGSEQSCGCRSLAECPDGKAARAIARIVVGLFPARDAVVAGDSVLPGSSYYPASRPRAPPVSS